MPTPTPSPERNYHPKYRPDIDGLRALAILPVVAYHAYPHSFPGGFVGVDVFFVISGFLISRIIFESLRDGEFSFIEFYAHRVRRIFPALVVVLAAFFGLGWFALLPEEYAQLGKHMAASVLFVQNFTLWLEAGYFDTASDLKPLLHLWSLAVEEQFYVFYPLMIWAVWRLRLNILAFIAVTALASFAFNLYEAGIDRIGDFFLPHTRYWELLAGALLAWHHHVGHPHYPAWLRRWLFHPRLFRQPPGEERQNALLAHIASALGLTLILFSVFKLDRSLAFPGWWALLPVAGAFLIIFAGRAAWVNARLLAARPLVFIGLISYPLYLWHWPLLAFAHIMGESRILAVVLAFVLAWLTYKLVERPLRFGSRTWLKPVALCVLMAGLGYAGYNDYSRGGLAFRGSVRHDAFAIANFDGPRKGLTGDEACYKRFPFMHHQLCQVARPSAPTVVLLGDSHANALYSGLAEATRAERGVNVLTLSMPGQAPLAGVDTVARNFGSADDILERARAFGQALSYVENTPSVRTVIIASRGPVYLSGYFLWHHEGDPRDFVMHDRGHPEVTDTRQIWRDAMREEIAGLVARGKRVIVVLDVAELGFDPDECADDRPLRISTFKPRTPCAVSRAEVDARDREYRALVASVVKEFPTVKVFDASAPLCDDKWCWATHDGKIVYLDRDHLNPSGSRLEGRELARLLAH